MHIRILAVLLIVALLLSLVGCGKSNDLEDLLSTYTWRKPGDVSLRFFPDGSGVQFDGRSGRIKENFRWELSGSTLHLILIEDDGEERDWGSLTVLDFNKYVITLEDEYEEVLIYCEDQFS